MKTLLTTKRCMYCKQTSRVELDTARLKAWRDGMLIQKAFPDMDADTREVLISGTHPGCWNRMFPPEDEE